MRLSRSAYIIVLILANLALDQISKIWVRSAIEEHEKIRLLSEKFILTNVENAGAFLGMGSDLNRTVWILVMLILPILVLGFVLRYVFKDKTIDSLSLIGFCCIIGGGIGNIYDRIRVGKVTDFLHIDLGGIFKTGIFNIADLSVTTGLIMILLASLLHPKNK
jgi:signal peptidase II